MSFTKDDMIRLIYTIIVSIIICLASSIIFFDSEITVNVILKSILVGSLIWFVSGFVMNYVAKKWPYNILPSFVALFILIAFGTTLGTVALGVESLLVILIICLSAEVFGMLITIIYYNRYKKRLNKQLREFKEEN